MNFVHLRFAQLSGKQSVPKRGSVGSVFSTRMKEFEQDPTLPRFGTDCLPLS